MNRKLTGVLVIGIVCVVLFAVVASALGQDSTDPDPAARAQEEQEWTGKLADGSVLTRADLDEILRKHNLWLDMNEMEGEKADLHFADLSGSSLIGANLGRADLSDADLHRANLSNTNLSGADLIGANLANANLHAVDLNKTILSTANLSGANLTVANLSEADLVGANLSGAWLVDTDLTDARVDDANFEGAIFEPKPKSLPYIPDLSSAENLDKMKYWNSPTGLVELRTALRDAGLRRQEREVNYAILHNRYEKMWENPNGFGDLFDAAFNYVFFELTCKYGMLPGRPLQIMGIVVVVFAIPYFRVMKRKHRRSRSDIWLDFADESVKPNRERIRRFRALSYKGLDTKFRGRIRRFRRIVFAAVYFSLLTSFRVGFREINVGNWITRMQCREYALRATGWVRFITGVQSLISVYLLALWLMTYFGRPFE